MLLILKNCYTKKINFGVIFLTLLLQSCATYHAQYGKDIKNPITENDTDSSKIAHTFFLVGDAGNANGEETQQTLELLSITD
jgi:hypothetical protein